MIELEDLRAEWAERDRSLAESVRVHSRLLHDAEIKSRLEAVRRHNAMRGPGLWVWIACLVGLGMFLAHHFGDWKFFAPAAALDVWTIVTGVVTLRERIALDNVDFTRPPGEAQRELARLRISRARTLKWALLTGQVVWWIPFAIVVFEGLFGVDLYSVSSFMPTFMAINIVLGLAFIPFALVAGRFIGPALVGHRVSNWVLDVMSGRDLSEAMALAPRLEAFG
jgi:hypothetical protein